MASAVSLARPAPLLGQTVIPYVRGPEDRHFFTSFQEQDNAAFARWIPDSSAPDDLYPLAPHRHEVQVLDISSGFKSPGHSAESCTKRMPNVAFYREPGGQCRAHTAIPIDIQQQSQSSRWNSRSVSAAAIRARVGGWTSPVRVTPAPHSVPDSLKTHNFNFNVDPSVQTSYDATSESARDATARKYMFTTTTQRSYEDVNWDCKLGPKIKPPDTMQDKIADPMSRHATLKRYDPSPHMWQAVSGHGHWDKTQSRPLIAVAKPITFCPNIPGYTGTRQWTGTESKKSSFSRLFHPPPQRVYGIPHGTEKPLQHQRQSPFSMMLTTVSPHNPFHTKISKSFLL
ncbi:spermatogenesis-associated protein 48 isoform X2 [Scyliorhinus canicula]|uniref:spermatogenesis-associated protein 48 isoform X2 n=1 Tax=Scyliorhinus canicula TaxID=7830 RepID=UPI0018F64856|nr:spermatogenesis-associated protein 48 isoform X2 [Scyliorhinus canicula]